MNDEELTALMLEVLKPRLDAAGLNAADLDHTTNLVELGIVDSLGFLELASEVENRSGRTLDLGDADPDEFTTVAGFVKSLKA